jgi:hypothetical protein
VERDKYMLAWNIEVMRFTGRRIRNQPCECAAEVVAGLTDWPYR